MFEQIFRRADAGDFLERRARVLQIREHEFFRHRAAFRQRRGARASERGVRPLNKRDVPNVRDGRAVTLEINVEGLDDARAKPRRFRRRSWPKRRPRRTRSRREYRTCY